MLNRMSVYDGNFAKAKPTEGGAAERSAGDKRSKIQSLYLYSRRCMAALELSGGTVPCMILDDADLEKVTHIREWREDKGQIAASRIFGGGGGREVSRFPTAFQSYKPDKYAVRTFPFIAQKGVGAIAPKPTLTAAPKHAPVAPWAKTVSSEGRPRASLSIPEERGSLIASVKQMLSDEELLQHANDIANFGIYLEPLEDEPDPPYASCTPPDSPKAN